MIFSLTALPLGRNFLKKEKEKHGYKGKIHPLAGKKKSISGKSIGTKRGIQEILNWENFLEKGKWVLFFYAISTHWPSLKPK